METNQLLINYYKKEEVKKAKQRRQEGCTLKEIIRLANKEYISIEEIKQALGIDEDEIEEHQEVGRVHHPGVDLARPFGKGLHHFLLNL